MVLDDAKAKQVLDFLRTLTVEKKLLPGSIDYQGAIALFANGAAGFHLNGEWEISTFQTAKMPFSMTLVPNVFGGTYAVQADSHTLVSPQRRSERRQPAGPVAGLHQVDAGPEHDLGGGRSRPGLAAGRAERRRTRS